jgi:hypothetical protein
MELLEVIHRRKQETEKIRDKENRRPRKQGGKKTPD